MANYILNGNDTVTTGTDDPDFFSISGDNNVANAEGGGDFMVSTLNSTNNVSNGGEGNDFLVVDGGSDNTINGDGGADRMIISQGSGNTLNGGDGNDDLSASNDSNSVLNGGSGDDLIRTVSSVSNTLTGGDGNDDISIAGISTGITVNGDAGNDTIYISAGGGHTFNGDAGNDTFNINTVSNSTINGDAGNDTFSINVVSNSTINGGDGDDVARFNNGNTVGNNTFIGEEGNDTLIGSTTGSEIIQFNMEASSNLETISFSNGTKQSDFVQQYGSWLQSQGTDLNNDGKVDVVWHQNSAGQPVVSVEGTDMSLFGETQSVTLSNGQIRYYSGSYGEDLVTSHDGNDVYHNFNQAADKLSFSGITADQFTTDHFNVNVTSDGNTVLALNDGSWSVTLTGVTDLGDIDTIRNSDYVLFA